MNPMSLLHNLPLAAANPVEHVINHKSVTTESGFWIWSAIQTNLILSAVIVLGVGYWASTKIKTGDESQGHDRYLTRNPLAHMIEVICSYLLKNTIEPLLHGRTKAYAPFLLTMFFFILVNNLLGLIPLLDLNHMLIPAHKADHMAIIGGTATQSIWVTGVLAAIAGLMINVAGVKELGVVGYLKHLTAGAPIFVWPLMITIEIAGTFIKPIALAIRLFANMTAGHILLAVVIGFVPMSLGAGLAVGVPVTLVSVVGAIAIYFLEIFVAFLQAFVFMFLTTVFISLLSHHGHEEDHDPHHGYDETVDKVAGAAGAALA
ncbi:MAG: F-type H+-transporting ATPase subunit a [Phycisphaerales bacterium]|jgi:F-type H+-transporting ATPase subunit a